MNRYYCPECESEYNFGKNMIFGLCMAVNAETQEECLNDLVELPEYETPQQYEMRTGKRLYDDCFVWVRYRYTNDCKCDYRWKLENYKSASYIKTEKIFCDVQILCAVINISPEPPPDDWKPEEIQ